MIDYDKIINGKEEECDNFPLSEFILGWVLFVIFIYGLTHIG